MIRDEVLSRFRERLHGHQERLETLQTLRQRLETRRGRMQLLASNFEEGLAWSRESNEVVRVPVVSAFDTPTNHGVDLVDIDANHRYHGHYRRVWTHVLRHLAVLIDRCDVRIRHAQEHVADAEWALLVREEQWQSVDDATLRNRVKQIVIASDTLSQFIVGRKVEFKFVHRDSAPLGYVPIAKHKQHGRRVFLSSRLLADPSADVLNYYQALLVHELGHLLLHLKESDHEYRSFQRLVKKRITAAPGFFDLFNIILDEQLERILRDTYPQWRTWFHRLTFHTRQLDERDFRRTLAVQGCPASTFDDLLSRKLLKRYEAKPPFVTIQSAAIFSEPLGFSRLFAFYTTLRHGLPRDTITEPWLALCLARIPSDFKTLDLWQLHELTTELYAVLFPDGVLQLGDLILRPDGRRVRVPGNWKNGKPANTKKLFAVKSKRKSYLVPAPPPPPPGVQQPDPECVIPPPPPPPPPPPSAYTPPPANPNLPKAKRWSKPVYAKTVKRQANKPPKSYHGGFVQGIIGSPTPLQVSASHRQSVKVKRRSTRPAKRINKSFAPKSPTPPSAPEKAAARPAQPLHVPEVDSRTLQIALNAQPGVCSPKESVSRALNLLVTEIRQELEPLSTVRPKVERMEADAGISMDRRNETSDETFPHANRLTLVPNRQANAELLQQARPWVNVLRPYLSLRDPARVLEERLPAGRRLLTSGLVKHVAYGEMRLFADHRQDTAEEYSQVLVTILIDTSGSMKSNNRLLRAKQLAVAILECLKDCAEVECVVRAFNENIYDCGTHDDHAIGTLEPSGKTNEAAALDDLRCVLASPRRRKLVLVMSDGLPTACSVASVERQVKLLTHQQGARCLHLAFSEQHHPAYSSRVNLANGLSIREVRAVGQLIANHLR